MNRKTRHSILRFILPLLFFSQGISAEIIDKILVIVNDEVITQREVDRRLAPLFSEYKTMYAKRQLEEKINAAYERVIKKLIQDKLVVSEAKRKGIEVDEEIVSEQVNSVMSRFASEEEFYLTLEEQGVSFKEFKENYRASLMARRLIDQEIGAHIVVTPSEMVVFYEANQDKFGVPERVDVSSILIRINKKRDSEQALRLVKEVMGKLRNGDDFGFLAKQYSDGLSAPQGGGMGYVKKGDMIPRVDEVLFTLKPGEISEIIRTDLGFHIFKVEGFKEAEMQSFDEISPKIEQILYGQRIDKELGGFLEKLKEKAYIEFK